MRCPLVGVGVFVKKDGKYLAGKRKGAHGEGTWALPGGHLEWGETCEEACRREVEEETGLLIQNIQKVTFVNTVFSAERHYITLFFVADYEKGILTNCEPDKCEGWDWFDLGGIPEPHFEALNPAIGSLFLMNSF